MIESFFLMVIAAGLTAGAIRAFDRARVRDVASPKQTELLQRLWDYATQALKKQRWDAAERALLKILKHDHKNVSAYNQLGMVYVRTKQLDNAAVCFEIASSLAPSVSSLYNLGLVQYQQGDFDAAARALERVIDLEPTIKRQLVFAKVLQKQGAHKRVVAVLESVAEEEPSRRNLQYLAEAYDNIGQEEKAQETRREITRLDSQTPQQFQPERMRT